MNREDLKNYKYNQAWIESQLEYIKNQMETVNKLSSFLSDEPRESSMVYDKEAERLTKLLDNFEELTKKIEEEIVKQNEIIKQINEIELPYRNILYKAYIQDKDFETVANELNYSYKYVINLNGEALNKFDKIDESCG